jgi:NADH-quinone oxidoreductase subunit J
MSWVFLVIAALTLLAAVGAMSLRHLVHCALLGAIAFAGLAAMFLHLGAQFAGLAQLLVYVGAVAILIVFAILLTRGSEPESESILAPSWWAGLAVGALVCATLIGAVLSTPSIRTRPEPRPDVSAEVAVRNIGVQLMTRGALPLEIVALLLTSAAIGAVLIAMPDKGGKR